MKLNEQKPKWTLIRNIKNYTPSHMVKRGRSETGTNKEVTKAKRTARAYLPLRLLPEAANDLPNYSSGLPPSQHPKAVNSLPNSYNPTP